MKRLFLFLTVAALFTSCSKDADEVLPGTWDTSDGGTVTFNDDGTGSTMGSEFFSVDFDDNDLDTFTWSLSGDNLTWEYSDSTSSFSAEFPVDVKNDDKVEVGASVLGLGIKVTLTR